MIQKGSEVSDVRSCILSKARTRASLSRSFRSPVVLRRVDDRRVISGIIYVIRLGLR